MRPAWSAGDVVIDIRTGGLCTVVAVRPSNQREPHYSYVYYVVFPDGKAVGPKFPGELRSTVPVPPDDPHPSPKN